MADKASKFKFNFNPKIECQVPGKQTLRERASFAHNGDGALSQGDTVEIPGDTYVPVLKAESFEETEQQQTANPVYSLIMDDVISGPHPLRMGGKVKAEAIKIQDSTSIPKEPKKPRTKIPVTRFRQTVERVNNDRVERGGGGQDIVDKVPIVRPQPRRSSIPKLQKQETKSTTKILKTKKPEEVPKSDLDIPKAEEEFDKIFDEIIEDKSIEYLDAIVLPDTKIDPELETNFEDIIHAYDEGKIEPLAVENTSDNRKSKIPLIKQKSLDETKVFTSIDRRNSLRERVKIKTIDFDDSPPVKPILGNDIEEKDLKEKQEAESKTADSRIEKLEKITHILRDQVTNFVRLEETKPKEDSHSNGAISKQEKKQTDWFKPIDLIKHPSDKKYQTPPSRRDMKKTSTPVEPVTYDAVKSEIRIGNENINEKFVSIENVQETNGFRPTPNDFTESLKDVEEVLAPDEFGTTPQGLDKVETDEEVIPILKGRVSRLISQISQVDSTEGENEQDNTRIDEEELPKPKSVLTKIAMFETIEPRPNPRTRVPQIEKPKRPIQSPRIETVKYEVIDAEVDRKPKIIEEVLKVPLRRNSQDNETIIKEIRKDEIVKVEQGDYNVEPNGTGISPEIVQGDKKPEIAEDKSEIHNSLKIDAETVRKEDEPSFVNQCKESENGYEAIKEENHPQFDRPFANPNQTATEDFELKSEIHKVSNRLLETPNGNEEVAERRENLIENRLRRLKSSTDSDKVKLERSKSIVDIEIEKSVKGKVLHIIQNMVSFEPPAKKETISVKERPRKKSVLEKIALFERKLTPVSMDEAKRSVEKGPGPNQERSIKDGGSNANTILDEEALKSKIAELNGAKAKYGNVTEMPTIELRNGMKMPVLAVGTALLEPSLTKAIIGAAIDLGYRAFDTAFIYGNERLVGEAIRAKIDDGTVKREDLFIMSKLWSTFHRPDLVQSACRASLQAMGLAYFDLYMIHNPMSFREGGEAIPTIAGVLQFSTHEYLDAWFPLEGAMVLGMIRAIGVANFNSEQVARTFSKAAHKPVVNQVECHPYLNQQRLAEFCANYDIRLSCYGTLGSKGTPAAYKSSGAASAIEDPVVKNMAAEMRASPAQILIRYQLERGHAVVVKSSTAAHLWDNLQALRIKLSGPQLEQINGLNKNRRNFNFKGMGDTHKNYPFKTPF